MEKFATLLGALKAIFADKAQWLLIVPAVGVMAALDLPRTITLLEWMLYAAVIAGFAIQVSLTVFPQIDLSDLVERAKDDPRASATVAAALVLFVALLILAVAIWTKP